MFDIDIGIISSSRPKLLPYLISSLKNKVHFDGSFNVILHEDFVYPHESKKVLEYAQNESFINHVMNDKPNVGVGKSIQKVLNQAKSKYILMLQDDGEFELPIDLNQLIWTMERNKEMNCIYFNKRKNMKTINGFQFEEYRFDHSLFLLHYHGPLGPGLGRTEYVKKRGKIAENNKAQEGFGNELLKNHNFDKSTLESIGCYIYGPLGFPRVMRHLGATGVTKPGGKGKRNKEGYGGNAELEFKPPSVQNRAPGLPEAPERPKYLDNKKDQIKDMKNKGIL